MEGEVQTFLLMTPSEVARFSDECVSRIQAWAAAWCAKPVGVSLEVIDLDARTLPQDGWGAGEVWLAPLSAPPEMTWLHQVIFEVPCKDELQHPAARAVLQRAQSSLLQCFFPTELAPAAVGCASSRLRGATLAIHLSCGDTSFAYLASPGLIDAKINTGSNQRTMPRCPGVSSALSQCKFSFVARVGTAQLSVEQLRELAEGDIVMCDEGQPGTLHYGSGIIAQVIPCTLAGHSAVMPVSSTQRDVR